MRSSAAMCFSRFQKSRLSRKKASREEKSFLMKSEMIEKSFWTKSEMIEKEFLDEVREQNNIFDIF